jgi:hypothetical protein
MVDREKLAGMEVGRRSTGTVNHRTSLRRKFDSLTRRH